MKKKGGGKALHGTATRNRSLQKTEMRNKIRAHDFQRFYIMQENGLSKMFKKD